MLQEAKESSENRSLELWKNDGDHYPLSCLAEIPCTFLGHRESAPCWRMKVEDVRECCLANRGVPWFPAGLAFEPKLKKAKMKIVHETLLTHWPLWWPVEWKWFGGLFVSRGIWQMHPDLLWHLELPPQTLVLSCSLFVLMCSNFVFPMKLLGFRHQFIYQWA